ncbi:MAG: hypothetical protein ACXW0J_02370 [Nitrososphaeraceae archaeon]|nr:hypothetical protein [Nitrososphaeraceae archaeon]
MKLESEGIKAIKEIFTNGLYANNNIKIQRVLENLRSKDDDNIESNNNSDNNSNISSSSSDNNEMSTGLNEDEEELTDEDIDNNKKF